MTVPNFEFNSGLPRRDVHTSLEIEIPPGAYPRAYAELKMSDPAPRHDVTLHFAPDALGICLVCAKRTTGITLRAAAITDVMVTSAIHAPAIARLRSDHHRGYRYEPCGCETV